jgi:hypothetical protein
VSQVNSRSIYTSFRDNTRHFYFVISTVAGHFSLDNETASLLRECPSSSRESLLWVNSFHFRINDGLPQV